MMALREQGKKRGERECTGMGFGKKGKLLTSIENYSLAERELSSSSAFTPRIEGV